MAESTSFWRQFVHSGRCTTVRITGSRWLWSVLWTNPTERTSAARARYGFVERNHCRSFPPRISAEFAANQGSQTRRTSASRIFLDGQSETSNHVSVTSMSCNVSSANGTAPRTASDAIAASVAVRCSSSFTSRRRPFRLRRSS